MRRTVEFIRSHRIEFLLFFVALVLYLPGTGWGLPEAIDQNTIQPWGHDAIAPLGPLAETKNTFLDPSPNRYLAYPLGHYFLLTLAYAPYLAIQFARGQWTSISAEYPYGLADPVTSLETLTLISNAVSAVMAAGTVAAAFMVGRSLWDHERGLLSAVFAMLMYPMFFYGRTSNLDVPALFWAAMALVIYARILRRGCSIGRAFWLAVFAAISAATKDQSLLLFALVPVVLIASHVREFRAKGYRLGSWRFWKPTLVSLAGGLLAYSLASGLIFRPERYIAHLAYILGLRADSPVYFGTEASLTGYLTLSAQVLSSVADSISWPILITALLGIGIAARHDRRSLLLLVPGIALILLMIVPTRYVEMRFLMPVSLTLVCMAAYTLGFGMRSTRIGIRRLTILVAIGLALGPALHGIELTYAMLHDSRYRASDWLVRNLAGEPDKTVGFFGPFQKLPRLGRSGDYVRLIEYSGMTRDIEYEQSDIQRMAKQIRGTSPRYVLIIPETNYPEFPYGNTLPLDLYDRFVDGSLGYRRVANIQTEPLFPWLPTRAVLAYPVVNPPIQIFEREADL